MVSTILYFGDIIFFKIVVFIAELWDFSWFMHCVKFELYNFHVLAWMDSLYKASSCILLVIGQDYPIGH